MPKRPRVMVTLGAFVAIGVTTQRRSCSMALGSKANFRHNMACCIMHNIHGLLTTVSTKSSFFYFIEKWEDFTDTSKKRVGFH